MADEGRKRKNAEKKGANLMKNLFKKISAILIAAVMVLAMASTAFAAEATAAKPTAGDSKQVKITNVESGATVKAYKLVQADYNNLVLQDIVGLILQIRIVG